MRHEPITMTFKELLQATGDSYIADEVAVNLGLGRIVHDSACCDVNHSEPECPGYRAYTPAELATEIRVSWPEHVLTPRLNADANYQLAS